MSNKKFVDEKHSFESMTLNYCMGNKEIFDRLLLFGNEPDRPVFCQRLQTIWDEQRIFCQTYPTITNQILDCYKLYQLVQEKQGYLEISTNRGWKEISNVLGFGDSGSAAYSVKKNYVRLGLLAYECRFDRAGIDPQSVLDLCEMPHAVKKRKRANPSTRTIVKVAKQQPQLPIQSEQDEIKLSIISSIDNSFRSITQQLSIHNLQHFPFLLRAGSLADSNRYLDTLLFCLIDPHITSSVNLKYLPGLFHAIIEQYIACLYELFDQRFLQSSSTNDYYANWFLESSFRIDECAIGPSSNPACLESLFYGTYHYIIKRMITSNESLQKHTDRDHSIITRCSCLATIIRNLSFIEENDCLANDRCLLDILERILNCSHDEMHDLFTDEFSSENFIERFTQSSIEQKIDCSLSCRNDCHQQHLIHLLDNTFMTLSNLSALISLGHCHFGTRYRLVNTLVHWICCELSFANETFISMLTEDQMRTFISPRQMSLQIFAKLCTNQLNVDLIFLDLNFTQLKFFGHTLLSIMNSSSLEDPDREYCLMIICSLCKRNEQLVQFFASQLVCLELVFNYLEFYEHQQQEYLIATLTSCYQPNSTIPVNTSGDMMIDSCIEFLELIASMKTKNYLRLFEYRLLEMSSSIYFEQRILKSFANILFIMKTETLLEIKPMLTG